ncbi:hypothetical protein B0H16DRAFT_638936 [Mycena metata]|uniref:Uncharacterized protein n=1 Tax=Mycena metata TaxID=1033252 RepID=A0AAD7H336_9AGAR|nr:hypothetical protein B0H16DRAFT_638936 [Mycena metata]
MRGYAQSLFRRHSTSIVGSDVRTDWVTRVHPPSLLTLTPMSQCGAVYTTYAPSASVGAELKGKDSAYLLLCSFTIAPSPSLAFPALFPRPLVPLGSPPSRHRRTSAPPNPVHLLHVPCALRSPYLPRCLPSLPSPYSPPCPFSRPHILVYPGPESPACAAESGSGGTPW